MTDDSGRTEADREAARLERERRRAARAAASWAPVAGSANASPVDAGDGAPSHAAPESPATEPAAPSVSDVVDTEHSASTDGDQWAPDWTAADDLAVDGGAGARTTPPGRPRGPRSRAQAARRSASAHRPTPHVALRRGLAVVLMLVAIVAVWFLLSLFQPLHGDGHGTVVVVVPHGASSSEVGDILVHDGVVSSSFFFELRATLAGDRSSIEAGHYRLPLDTSYGDALRILTAPPPPATVQYVTIIPGLARRQVDALLRSEHVHGSYLAATRHSPLLDPATYGAPGSVHTLEGFLFPDTYQVYKPLRIGELVDDQLTAFKHEFATVDFRYARAHNLSEYDVLIVASLIQGEAATAHDMALVSAVVYNRLRDGMNLGLDASTRYATDNYTSPLSVSELASPSPYNTRNHAGLPPTPINSPGLEAINAAAHPASSNALYFVVKPCGNGEMTFTASYQQFLADSAAYARARADRGGNSPEFCHKR